MYDHLWFDIIIYMIFEWTHRFFSLTHHFLKWEFIAFFLWLIAFWNKTSSLFEMRHHRLFLLIQHDHHITFYNIYDHRWMSFLHAFDDMQRNFSSVWKKFENDFLMRRNQKLNQNDELRDRKLDQNEVCALFSFDNSFLYDHHSVSFLYEFDDMQENFFICMKKIRKQFFDREDQRLDQNDESEDRELDQNEVVFFLWLIFDHHITFYNIYDHWWVSLLHAFDDMQRNFSSVWKNSKTILWCKKIEKLIKMMNWEIEDLIKMKSARFSFSSRSSHHFL